MENINYLNDKISYDRDNILKFDFDTLKFADFLIAFSDVLNTVAADFINDEDVIMRGLVGHAVNPKRLIYNFSTRYKGTSKEPFANSIYRDFDNKLVVYKNHSSTHGIQFGKTKEEYTKYIANIIKKLSFIKYNYDCLHKFTNEALAEFKEQLEDMCRKNGGKLVPNSVTKETVFRKKITINNAMLEFVEVYGNDSTNKNLNEYRHYSYLSIKFNSGKHDGMRTAINYKSDLTVGRYSHDVCRFLDKLDFGDGFKNEWNAENKGPSIFGGFTVGEVYNIYCLMADKKNAIKTSGQTAGYRTPEEGKHLRHGREQGAQPGNTTSEDSCTQPYAVEDNYRDRPCATALQHSPSDGDILHEAQEPHS